MTHAQLVQVYDRLTRLAHELFILSGKSDYGFDEATSDLLDHITQAFDSIEAARKEAQWLRATATIPPSPPSPVPPDEAPF